MATRLTTTAVGARKLIKFGIIGLILIMILRVILIFVWGVIQSNLPEKEIPATAGFGSLPAITFPVQKNELPILEYKIDTPSGTLPIFPELLPVYTIESQYSDLFSYDSMVEVAKTFGFTQEPAQDLFNERKYVFSHRNVPSRFEYDIVTGTFSISYNLASDSAPIRSRSRTPESALTLVKDRLGSAQILNEDLREGKTSSTFLKAEGQNLVRALALADAELVQINLFRDNIQKSETFEGYPAVTPDPNRANVWFIVSGSGEKDRQIIAGEYKYFNVDFSLFETYEIKTAEQALRELVDGKGYVANLGFNVDGNIEITDIYLAYYDPNIPTSFMQPVVVFEGRDDFIAYVAAIKDQFIAQPSAE